KSTQEGWQSSGKIGYGSYNTALFSGTLGYKKEKLSTFLSINRTSTDGYRKAGSDEFRNTTGFFRMDYALRPTLNLTGDVQIADAVYFHPGTINFPLENDKREYFRGRAAVSLKNAFQNLKGGLFLYFNWGDHRFAEGFQSNDINRGLTFFQNFKIFQGNKFTVGFDHKSFGGEAQNESIPPPARIGFGEKHKVQESDIYISVQQELGRKITFHGGIRWANNSAYG